MKKEDLRIVFMGTPEFAVETLKSLYENHFNVVAVVTQPDKPVGRHGSVLQPSAVKQYALSKGIPVLQPEKMKDPTFIEELQAFNAHLQVVVAFRMLPQVVWDMPPFGTFNVHASLLPQYRGAAPINWAVINGETQTGVTTFFLDHNIDTGRVIMQESFDIPDEVDVEYVYDGLMHLGAALCLKTIDAIVATDGHPATLEQKSDTSLKAAPKLFKDNCRIAWDMSAKQVYDFVRGLSPYPGAWTELVNSEGQRQPLKIFRTQKTVQLRGQCRVGQVVTIHRQLFIACADYLLEIVELQQAGRRRMNASDYLNGIKTLEVCSVV